MSENNRNTRKSFTGTVVTKSGDKSLKVIIPYKIPHPRYGKIINRKTVVHVHDEQNEANPGDKVLIMETRPLSKSKRWRVVKKVESAPVVPGTGEPVVEV